MPDRPVAEVPRMGRCAPPLSGRSAPGKGKEGTMQTKANEGNHFLQVLNQEIVEREHELEDCQRKLTILKDLRENYISASRRSEGQHRYRLTSDWRTAT